MHEFLQLHGDFKFELLDIVLQVAEADAVPDHVDEDDGEGEQGEEEGDFHVAGHAESALRFGGLAADDHRVNGAEEADDHECDGRTDAAQQCVDCAKARAFLGVFQTSPQHKVGDVDQFGDGGGGDHYGILYGQEMEAGEEYCA